MPLLLFLAPLKIYVWGRVCVRACMYVFRMYVCERPRKRVSVRMCAWESAYGRMYGCKCERVFVCLFVDKGWVCLFGVVCVHNCLMHVRSFLLMHLYCLMHVRSFFADAPLLLDARALFFADGPLWVVSRRALTWGQGFVLTAHSGPITTTQLKSFIRKTYHEPDAKAATTRYFFINNFVSFWFKEFVNPGETFFKADPLGMCKWNTHNILVT